MTLKQLFRGTAVVLIVLAASVPTLSQDHAEKKAKRAARKEAAASLPAVLMHDSEDIGNLDLYYGPGGKKNAPSSSETYTFLDEDLKQHSPKFDVKDAQGQHWRIKLGLEARPETAATRLVWAAGYFVDDDYYFKEIKVDNLPSLHRGGRFVSEGGMVRNVRLELRSKSVKKLGSWAWSDNPFVGTRELNGLRVMMALINNWDMITLNNSIYEEAGQRRFVISDLGASFGRSGNDLTRSKGKMKDYVHSKFIARITPDTVDFVIHARPLPFTIIEPHYYANLVHGQEVYKHIPRADARWVGQRLAQLSDSQIRDCFRAAGFSPEQVDGYANALHERIAELNAL